MTLLVDNFYLRVKAGEIPLLVRRADGYWDIASWEPADRDDEPLLHESDDQGERVVELLSMFRAVCDERVADGTAPTPGPLGGDSVGQPAHVPHNEREYSALWARIVERARVGKQPIVQFERLLHEDGSGAFNEAGDPAYRTRYLCLRGNQTPPPDSRHEWTIAYLVEMERGRFDLDARARDVSDELRD